MLVHELEDVTNLCNLPPILDKVMFDPPPGHALIDSDTPIYPGIMYHLPRSMYEHFLEQLKLEP